MPRAVTPKHRMCRIVGHPLCGSPKCPSLKRPYAPGQHGIDRGKKLSEYGRRLLEKQKLKSIYNVRERQYKRYFERALKSKEMTSEKLLSLLERRLDNIAYRMGFAPTIYSARQLVSHGHILVNGKKVNIPSYEVKVGDVVSVNEKSKNIPIIKQSIGRNNIPPYINVDVDKMEGKLIKLPRRSEIPVEIDDHLLVEFY
ncbi:MAG TPA: 30S ribosomal protein S4 [Thermoanaerobacterium sp.]|nr:30S ribosomal protein S4 [Thermoanaerobacterium sp.]